MNKDNDTIKKFELRLPPELHEALRVKAFEERTSMNSLIVEAVKNMFKKT